jgi:hypothetical protein
MVRKMAEILEKMETLQRRFEKLNKTKRKEEEYLTEDAVLKEKIDILRWVLEG